jgi:hypothetical protein
MARGDFLALMGRQQGPSPRKCPFCGEIVHHDWLYPPAGWHGTAAWSVRSLTLFQGQGGAKYPAQIGDAADAASPHRQDLPALLAKSPADTLVAFPVRLDLVRPEFPPRGRQFRAAAALVAVPKAFIDENGHMELRNNYVRRAGQPPIVSPETNSVPTEESLDEPFREGIRSATRLINQLRFCFESVSAIFTVNSLLRLWPGSPPHAVADETEVIRVNDKWYVVRR